MKLKLLTSTHKYVTIITVSPLLLLYRDLEEILDGQQTSFSPDESDSDVESDVPIFSGDEEDEDAEPFEEEVPELERIDRRFEKTLSDFFRFLIGPNVLRDERTVNKVVGDVRRIIYFSNSAHDIPSMFKNKCQLIRKNYIGTYARLKQLKDSALKTYMYPLLDFIRFLQFLPPPEFCTNQLADAKMVIQNWRSVYQRKEMKSVHERRDADYEMLIIEEQVSTYMHGPNVEMAKKTFSKVLEDDTGLLRQREYVSFRDHLLLLIHLTTAHRSGVSSNMKISEYKKLKEDDESFILRVADHKTAGRYGPAPVLMELFLNG